MPDQHAMLLVEPSPPGLASVWVVAELEPEPEVPGLVKISPRLKIR